MNFKTKMFPNLSLKTVVKIINQDTRNTRKIAPKLKHKLRLYNLPFGNIQMDLKIIGNKESPTGKRITIFDAKDEQSKLYFIEVIENASMHNLLKVTAKMISYFECDLDMKIKRIRTDNAMTFKQTNFVRSFPYDQLLKFHNIINEKIPINQPQCNGVIERQHLVLDKEFIPLIKPNDTLKTMNEKAKLFMQNFNFNRFHYYSFLSKSSNYKTLESRLFIPFNFYQKHKI